MLPGDTRKGHKPRNEGGLQPLGKVRTQMVS